MIADTILRYFPNDYIGVLIEVGAGFPEMGSPILPIRKKGWNIISVEPNPVLCNEFKELNLPILEYAAYNEDIGETEFVVYPNGLSFSCLKLAGKNDIWNRYSKDEYNSGSGVANNLSKNFDWEFFPRAGKTKTIKVMALTLNTIFKKHYPLLEKIDVMIVDVEGFEIEVMQGIDLKKYNPKVVVLENMNSDPFLYGQYMESNNYVLDNKIYIDDFYIRKDK